MSDATRRNIGVAIGIPEPYGASCRTGGNGSATRTPSASCRTSRCCRRRSVATEALPEIEEHLRRVAATVRPFDIRLRGSATFLPVSPVVFVPLVAGIAECERLEVAVRSGPLQRTSGSRTTRMSRSPTTCPTAALERAYVELAPYDASFRVWGLTVFEQGPDQHWRPQRDVTFGAGGLPGPTEERFAGHDEGW